MTDNYTETIQNKPSTRKKTTSQKINEKKAAYQKTLQLIEKYKEKAKKLQKEIETLEVVELQELVKTNGFESVEDLKAFLDMHNKE